MGLDPEKLKELPLWIIAFLISGGLHEFAHALTAFRLGDRTAADTGRLTINPISHIDPTGLVFLIVSAMFGVGIGWAKPVPVNPYNFRFPRRDMMLVSLSGPVMNILLAALFVGIWWLAGLALRRGNPILNFIDIFAYLNVILASFNLIPLGMLDGAKIVSGLLPEHLAEKWERTYPYGTIVLLVLVFSQWLWYILFPLMTAVEIVTGYFTLGMGR